MNVAEAVAGLGIDASAVDGEIIIVQVGKDGGTRNYKLPEVASKPVSRDLYITSGTFKPDTVTDHKGRAAENVAQVLWLPIDCDLKDYTGRSKEELWGWSDGDLMTAVHALESDARRLFEYIDVPIHRIDYTGYGICIYVYLDPASATDLPMIRATYKALVTRLNHEWKGTVADPHVSDAGTRFTRLVPCPNTKGPQPRLTKVLYRSEGYVSASSLATTLNARTTTSPGQAIPRVGNSLDPATLHTMCDVVARNWERAAGNRHALALAFSATMAKAGIAEDQTRFIVEQAAKGFDDLPDRLKAVETTYARARSGLQVRGYFGLKELLPAEDVDWIDRTLDEFRVRSSVITFTVTEAKPDAPKQPGLLTLPVPDIARQGLIDEYIRIMGPTTEASDGFHLGVALTVMGSMIGRSVYANFGKKLHANLFTLLVGDSGQSRKDTAIGCGIDLLNTTYTTTSNVVAIGQKMSTVIRGSGVKVATDIASGEGLIKTLRDNPNILMYLSEFTRLMGNASRQGTKTITPILMESFDTPASLSNLSKLDPVEAKDPYLSILAATQPIILESLLSEGDIHSGFINRWLIIPGKSKGPNAWPPDMDRDWLELVFRQASDLIGTGDPRGMSGSDGAKAYWTSWYEEQWHRQRSDDEKSMSVRHPVMAIKIALIYAVLNGDAVIDRRHLETGVAVVEWMSNQVMPMLPGWGASPLAKLEQRIVKVLVERGPIKRYELSAQASNPRRWTSQDIKRTVDAMMDNGVIATDTNGLVGLRG